MIDHEELLRVLAYDPLTGVFAWRVRLSKVTPVGSRAGSIYANGRRYITIGRKRYFASRLAWFYVHGRWPTGLVDHRDRGRSNDAIDNLREATNSQNGANTGPQANNQCGIKGVQARPNGKWRARIRVHGHLIDLGTYASSESASAAYLAAAEHHFGEFASAA